MKLDMLVVERERLEHYTLTPVVSSILKNKYGNSEIKAKKKWIFIFVTKIKSKHRGGDKS